MAEVTSSPAVLAAAAEAARYESIRLRTTLAARRLELRRAVHTAHCHTASVTMTLQRIEQMRNLRLRSPWSDLPWCLPDEELQRVLVLHDDLQK